ncbi:MAG: alpha/beta hydrolase [Eggerthellaceae bacterium]|nr:alpha/beta hydrolase [Eggerthellaceae bacterium]
MSGRARAFDVAARFVNDHAHDLVKRTLEAYAANPGTDLRLPRAAKKAATVEEGTLRDVPFLAFMPKGNARTTIVYAPGGGGTLEPLSFQLTFAARLSAAAQARVVVGRYPKGPQANAIDAINWVERLYIDAYVKQGKEDTFLMGDGIGANLCLAISAQTDAKPTGLICVSPDTGLGEGDQRESLKAHEGADQLLSSDFPNTMKKSFFGPLSFESALVNPRSITFDHHFPPTLMLYGGKEMYRAQDKALIETMHASDVHVESHRYDDLPHCGALMTAFPEHRDAIARMATFVESRLGAEGDATGRR